MIAQTSPSRWLKVITDSFLFLFTVSMSCWTNVLLLPLLTTCHSPISTTSSLGKKYAFHQWWIIIIKNACYIMLLFTRCIVEDQVNVINNGDSTAAHFEFEAFRFVQHRAQELSTIYLHCILTLCEPSKCNELTSVSKAPKNYYF